MYHIFKGFGCWFFNGHAKISGTDEGSFFKLQVKYCSEWKLSFPPPQKKKKFQIFFCVKISCQLKVTKKLVCYLRTEIFLLFIFAWYTWKIVLFLLSGQARRLSGISVWPRDLGRTSDISAVIRSTFAPPTTMQLLDPTAPRSPFVSNRSWGGISFLSLFGAPCIVPHRKPQTRAMRYSGTSPRRGCGSLALVSRTYIYRYRRND